MGKFLAILGGIIAIAGGAYLIYRWWVPFKMVVFGIVPPVLIFGGLIALIAGISSIKDAARTKKLEEEARKEEK